MQWVFYNIRLPECLYPVPVSRTVFTIVKNVYDILAGISLCCYGKISTGLVEKGTVGPSPRSPHHPPPHLHRYFKYTCSDSINFTKTPIKACKHSHIYFTKCLYSICFFCELSPPAQNSFAALFIVYLPGFF